MKKLLFLFPAILFSHFVNAQYLVGPIPYAPPYPFTGGTQAFAGTDDVWSNIIALPFNFNFYGNIYNKLVIGVNGIISFDTTYAGAFCPWSFSDQVPSSSLPLNSIFGAYHDIDPSMYGNINYNVYGVAPNRAFVINFDSVAQFDCTNLSTTQQIVLYESTNDIEVYIKDKPLCSGWNNGNAVIGIQNAIGLMGIAPLNRNTGAWSATNEAWRFHCVGNPNIIYGRVLLDNNCTIDGTEQGLGGFIVKTIPNGYYSITDSLGRYAIQTISGTYQVEQVIPNSIFLITNPLCPIPNYYTVHFDTLGMDTTGLNFFNEGIVCPYLTIDISSNPLRRCFRNYTNVHYCNEGYANVTGVEVHVQLPDYVEFISADHAYSIDTSGNYIFDIGNLNHGCGDINIIDSVSCINGILGLTQCTKAWITPVNDCANQLDTTYTQWDHSSVMVEGACVGDTIVQFTITNTGTLGSGDMQIPSEFRIFEDGLLVFTGNFQLLGQEDTMINIPANGKTYRLEADQNSYHPGNSHPNETVESCGDPYNSTGLVNVFPMDDEDAEVEIECLPIVSSYDPNEKSVSPEGITSNHYIKQGTELDYVIRFQNTGTDTAFNVAVVDTLSEKLDISTFSAGVSSYPYVLEVDGQGKPVLHFIFYNINLPDSTTDEANSHGFVKFKVTPNNSLPNSTVIENTAEIYFDYNMSVITNTTFVTISDTVLYGNPLVIQNTINENNFTIYPNPTKDKLTILTTKHTMNSLSILNITGQLVKSIKLNGQTNKYILNIEDLPVGLYLLKITGDNGAKVTKFIKQ